LICDYLLWNESKSKSKSKFCFGYQGLVLWDSNSESVY
jgi:hypothetical protein